MPVPGRSDTITLVDVLVKHSAMLGYRDLDISAANGRDHLGSAVAVTAIEASPTGDDASGKGTHDLPFRTATMALASAVGSDIVQLADGEYSTLESWPLSIKTGMHLRGTSRAGTILRFSGGLGIGIQEAGFISDVTISGTLGNQSICLAGQPVATRIEIDGCSTGIRLDYPGHGMSVDDAVIRNTQVGVLAQTADDESVQIFNTDIQLPTGLPFGTGISINLSGSNSMVSIMDSVIDATSYEGIAVSSFEEGPANRVEVQNTAMRAASGVIVFGNHDMALALGSIFPLLNTIDATVACVDDRRVARLSPDGPFLELSGTKLNGKLFASGSIVTGATSNLPFYDISAANNRISF